MNFAHLPFHFPTPFHLATPLYFASPVFLWALVLLPVVYLWRGRSGRRAAVGFSSVSTAREVAREVKSRWGRWLPLARTLALAAGILALARPQIAHAHTDAQASGVDLVLALDVSGSMSSLDFKRDDEPVSRLDVVKSVVKDFVGDRPNDRIGMIAFAGRPYLVSPLTLDHDWLVQNLERVRLGAVEDGTAIGSALGAAVNRLRGQPSKSKVVILLTDGVNNSGSVAPELAAEAAKALGVRVYTIGVGVRGEAPTPVTSEDGSTRLVMTKVDIDEDTLRKIADVTGGKYFRATDTGSLREIYAAIDKMEKTTHTVHRYETHEERFAWFLTPAACLLALELGFGMTRFRRVP
ncbi:MAG TPA: VWA domain-containing protein [Polyangiaceae bacterium]|nr:VWA domain-containing protein [Polyangiaceae bacterium]